jgi:hypothetical protein
LWKDSIERAAMETAEDVRFEHLRARIQQLLSYLEQHESHENLMVLSVFTEDVGLSD